MQAQLLRRDRTGCLEIAPKTFRDQRGEFIKVFNRRTFQELGIDDDFKEIFYTSSARSVLRGLHFLTPPFDQSKLVYCVSGCVFDVAVDLRKGSPCYGEFVITTLSSTAKNLLYIPRGFAHGCCSLADESIVAYHVSSLYSQEHDAGILWNSVPIPWPVSEPIISSRDGRLPSLCDFESPFVYESARE